MSAQQNKLLDALGSSLRVSEDEVKNDVTNIEARIAIEGGFHDT